MRARGVGDAPVSAEHLQRRLGRLPVGGGIAESVLLDVEAFVLVGVGEPGRLELVQLEPEQIGLSGAGPDITAQVPQARPRPAAARRGPS